MEPWEIFGLILIIISLAGIILLNDTLGLTSIHYRKKEEK
jgi:hypothetical protein